MRTAVASLFVTAVVAAALILTGSAAAAQPASAAATVVRYDQCEEFSPATRSSSYPS